MKKVVLTLVPLALCGFLCGQLPLVTGDLTDPAKLANNPDNTDPNLTNPTPVGPQLEAELEAARKKLCQVLSGFDPLANPQLPAGLPADEPLLCWLQLKMTMQNACVGLEDKIKPLPGPGQEGSGKGEVVTGGLPDFGIAYTIPDERDPDTNRTSRAIGDGNIIVLNKNYVDPTTGACGFPGEAPAPTGTPLNRRLLGQLLFHEYLHCIERSDDLCSETRNHARIFYLEHMLAELVDLTCPLPAQVPDGAMKMWKHFKFESEINLMMTNRTIAVLNWSEQVQ